MLPIHGVLSNLPPLVFHSDVYKLLFYPHYESVSSTGNRSSGSGTVPFSLLYPQILITGLGIQEGSELADCLWISRRGLGMGAHLLWLWARGCGFRECGHCTARKLCENNTYSRLVILIKLFTRWKKKPHATGNPNLWSPALDSFLQLYYSYYVSLTLVNPKTRESRSPSYLPLLNSVINLNIPISLIPVWSTPSPPDLP